LHPVLRYLPLLPVLIPQAIGVARGALKLPEAAGPRHAVTGSGPDLCLQIIGDSSAAGVGASDQSHALAGQLATALSPHCTVTWNLIAKTGATTASTLKRLNALPPPHQKADVVITVLGVNDVTRAVGTARWIAQQSRLIAWVKRHHDPALHYMTGLPPMGDFPLLPHPRPRVLTPRSRRCAAPIPTPDTSDLTCHWMST